MAGNRYSSKEINKFSKRQLVDIILQRPDVVWPERVCKYNAPDLLSVKHLRKAILGGYGYGRLPQQRAGSGTELLLQGGVNGIRETPVEQTGATFTDVNEDQVLYTRMSSDVEPTSTGNRTAVSIEIVPNTLSDLTENRNTASNGVIDNDFIMPANNNSMGVDQVAVSAPPESEQLYVHSDEHTTGSENVSSVEIELANDDGNVIENRSSYSHSFGDYDIQISSNDSGTCAMEVPMPGSTIAWRREQDFIRLRDFIENNKELKHKYEIVKIFKGRHQPDSKMVHLYRCGASLFQALNSNRAWRNYEGKIPCHHILKFCNITASWASNAKTLCSIVDRLGPESKTPDNAVVERLNEKNPAHKGKALLPFLKERLELRQRRAQAET